MTETEVIRTDAKYGRTAYLAFRDNECVFDVADGEYGIATIYIELLEQKLKEHKEKLNES